MPFAMMGDDVMMATKEAKKQFTAAFLLY